MQHVGNCLTGMWSANLGISTYTVLPMQKETSFCLLKAWKVIIIIWIYVTLLKSGIYSNHNQQRREAEAVGEEQEGGDRLAAENTS